MYPSLDSSHVAEGLALFTDHYKSATVLQGIETSLLQSIQTLENTFWDIINKSLLANVPTGDQLQKLGRLVGATYTGQSDADFLAEIYIQIRVNRSAGLSEDIIQIASVSAHTGPAPDYLDYPGFASFLIELWNVGSPLTLVAHLTQARSVGTRGVLHYSTWVDGNDFEFASSHVSGETGAGPEGGWSSRYATSIGGLMVAGVGL